METENSISARDMLLLTLAVAGGLALAAILYQTSLLRIQEHPDGFITQTEKDVYITVYREGESLYAIKDGSDVQWELTGETDGLQFLEEGDCVKVRADISTRTGGVAGISEMTLNRIRTVY